MSKFDPNKPYGTIHGDNFGRVYSQGGKNFDVHGNEVIVTEKMHAEQLAREAELAAEGGDDKDAVIAALTRRIANLTGDDKPKEDPRDAQIKELQKKAADLEKSKTQQKSEPDPKAEVKKASDQASGLTMASLQKQ